MADVAALLAAYDDQVRPSEARNLPAGAYAEADGPIVRVVGLYQGFVSAPAELALDGDELDALIARQREFFAGRGEAVEWKTRAHDRPDDLPDRLCRAGFVPEPTETVLIGLAGLLVARRAQFAAARGVRFLQVDASDDSRPILERLGFVAITTTTPYVWTPQLAE